MKGAKPSVEVMVASIDQEYSTRRPRPDWVVHVPPWLQKSWWPGDRVWYGDFYWPCDIGPPIEHPGEKFEFGRLFLRVEEFGATVYDPITRVVFKVNKTGAEIVLLFQEGLTVQQVAKKLQLKVEEVKQFVAGFEKALGRNPG
jgi:hypothetical protein